METKGNQGMGPDQMKEIIAKLAAMAQQMQQGGAQGKSTGGLDLAGMIEMAKKMQQQAEAKGVGGQAKDAKSLDLAGMIEMAKKMQQQAAAQGNAQKRVVSTHVTGDEYWANACKEAGIPYIRGEAPQNTRARIREAKRAAGR
jgi:hypothetical protein